VRTTPVVIIGAGPYGPSIAAHLRARGVDHRIFGAAMSFWLRMPATINLKSFAWATNVAVPEPHFTFPEYCRAHGLPDLEPCSMESFAAYGLFVQRALVPDVEDTWVTAVRQGRSGGFDVELEKGESVHARAVVVATGLESFAHVPESLAGLTNALVTHSSEHRLYEAFRGKEVAVVGGGASALETATMLHEAGARPLLVVRDARVEFHTRFDPRRSLAERIRAPNSVLGPGRKSWVLDKLPLLLHYVPESRRVRFTERYLGAAGPWWLFDRFDGKVDLRLRTEVVSAKSVGEKVLLELRDADHSETRIFDHVIAGTGFQVDVDRIAMLDRSLAREIRRVGRAPALTRHFESSVPGLFFVGASSALSFGPLLRFVAGARVAAPRVAQRIRQAKR